METDVPDTNLVRLTKRTRIKLFFKTYKKLLITAITPIVLLPVAFLGYPDAYCSLYIFLVCAVFWTTNALHPALVSLVPITSFTIARSSGMKIVNMSRLGNPVLDCLGVMLISIAIEHSHVHRRIALKILLIFGISHSRLGFLFFFSTMLISMCCTDTLACCIMLPIVRAMLNELERAIYKNNIVYNTMGILEAYETGQKDGSRVKLDESSYRPSDLALFYFIGVAFSSTIGGAATILGSSPTQVFVECYEAIFPTGPKIEFPDMVLIALPAVLVMESLLYLWLNIYFKGMIRIRNYTTLETGLTGEEAQYIKTLLTSEYGNLGKLTSHEMTVSGVITLTAVLGVFTRSGKSNNGLKSACHYGHLSVPTLVGALVLCIIPTKLDCIKFCQQPGATGSLPAEPIGACLTWSMIKSHLDWSVLVITAGTNMVFEGLYQSTMMGEFGKFLKLFSDWSTPALVLVITMLCKVLTEFGSNDVVIHSLLYQVAKLVIARKTDPRYLMMGATLACSLPFHLITATPVHAIVISYANIPPRKMMLAGIGPSVVATLAIMFTACLWVRATWPLLHVPSNWTEPAA